MQLSCFGLSFLRVVFIQLTLPSGAESLQKLKEKIYDELKKPKLNGFEGSTIIDRSSGKSKKK